MTQFEQLFDEIPMNRQAPSPDNAIRECPHCGKCQMLSPFVLYLWYEIGNNDDEARYYLFHETEKFLSEYWQDIENEYQRKGKVRGHA